MTPPRLTPQQRYDRAVTEEAFLQTVREAATVTGWSHYHTRRSLGSDPGFPDLVLVHPRKQLTLWVELKREVGRVSPFQVEWLDVLTAAGEVVYLWRPSDLDGALDVLRLGSQDGPGRWPLALAPSDQEVPQ